MRVPDRRRRSGRALGTTMVLVALAASLSIWGPVAWAQTVEPPPTTTEPPPTPSPPPTTPPTTTPPTSDPAPPPPTDDPTSDPPRPTQSLPNGSGGGGVWSATSTPTWAPKVAEARANRDDELRRWRDWTPTPGAFDTTDLDRFAERMRERGWGEGRIRREIYAPFIVVGPATWSDSWGALRLVAGPRPHLGQDVLCTYGAAVLATESGTVTWSTNTLGGLAAYLHLPNGGFYYYAHLSGTPEDLPQGARVDPGDVIGFCGATGNASVPHVHFSHVTAGGESVDPMDLLRGWLRTAERRLPNPPKPQGVEELPADPRTVGPVGWEQVPDAPPVLPDPPETVSPGARAVAALDSPVTVPVAMLLFGVPLLGLLRRRTREPWS